MTSSRLVAPRPATECIEGLSPEGALEVKNHYRCPHCDHKTTLPLFALGERAARWARSGPEEPELDDEDIPYFAPLLDRALREGPSRMHIEFECRCGRPVAMVLAVVAGGFVERFFVVLVVDRVQ